MAKVFRNIGDSVGVAYVPGDTVTGQPIPLAVS